MENRIIKIDKEVLEVDSSTGEILINANKHDLELMKQTKIKAVNVLSKRDFVNINGTWEAKRDGLMKILSSLPISYSWEIKEKQIDHNLGYAEVVGVLTVISGNIKRRSDGMGICSKMEFNEKVKFTLHNMNARAETRALKRAIETLFGSVINYFVLNYMEAR
ncbi:MAG: hypothetical protein KA157_14550 [Aliarcobacter sp.]|nr:hypothetical protein [Aliarcobacter sp.]